ncbi:MAG: PSD1 domain-containing protein [Acidobacteriia bacterium]|nr:PSD1 domain-containing protein [Terriglobia bacterium]
MRKVFAAKCWACHTQTAMGGLRLDSRDALLRGGKSGPAIVPGDAAASRLFRAVSRTQAGVMPMPPGDPLDPAQIRLIQDWINAGASWAEAPKMDPAAHWAFQPLAPGRSLDSLDTLIGRAQQSAGLSHNPRAGRSTLIRRAFFDLTGLPPDNTQFAEAMGDQASDWFARMVSRLLDSPHFGEKWARHWLDVARYGEDDFSGTAVIPYFNAWRFRDWVVQSINTGMPYDKFLMAQLAGDLMDDPSLLPGTGLIGLGPWYYGISQPPQARADERHDRVDLVTRGMLGVTVACARCHDHKYDPFTSQDYYALAGVFASSAYKEYPLVPPDQADAWKKQEETVKAAEKSLHQFLDAQAARLSANFSTQIAAYMTATVEPRRSGKLNPKVLDRWKKYLAKPEEFHPYLESWFQGNHTTEEAERFQRLILDIVAEKKIIDEENRRLVETGAKDQPKVQRTIVLPGGYRSEEDFNPGAYIPTKSLERNRFVAYNRILGENTAPLKFNRELTASLLEGDPLAEYRRLNRTFQDLKKKLPPQYPYLAGAAEFQPLDLQLNRRGNPEDPGDVVPRRFPLVLSGGKPLPLNAGSGRLQLAEAVAHHPLAARVAVNRVWLNLFGQGLVQTPSNFGRMGDRPVLPEVLDFLAAGFARQNYSLKSLIRTIVVSDAYQRSSALQPASEKLDPGNRYFWRQNRRRLDAEPLLDAMLAVSGELDRTLGGESRPLNADLHRRTLYVKTSRFQQNETLSLFDLPVASVTCEQRAVTNVPLQKLVFLNSDIVSSRAAALARRVRKRNIEEGIERAYQLLFQRAPGSSERKLAAQFLRAAGKDRWEQYAQVLLSSNEFAYVD